MDDTHDTVVRERNVRLGVRKSADSQNAMNNKFVSFTAIYSRR